MRQPQHRRVETLRRGDLGRARPRIADSTRRYQLLPSGFTSPAAATISQDSARVSAT
jgi:hypothetical protein